MRIEMTLSQRQMNDILITAFEGGINYWCKRVELVRSTQERGTCGENSYYAPEGFEWRFWDEEENQWMEPTLTAATLDKGVEKWCEKTKRIPNFLDEDDDSYVMDADDADMVVQFALFGEIVFG